MPSWITTAPVPMRKTSSRFLPKHPILLSMGSGTAAAARDDEKQRHICCTMTSVLLRTVRTLKGEAGVSEMLAHARSKHDAEFLENTDNWISLDEAVALMEAGVRVTGDPLLARRVGEHAVRQHAGT